MFFRDNRGVVVSGTLVAVACILTLLAGGLAGYFLKPDYSEKVQELESKLTSNRMKSDLDIYMDAEREAAESMNFIAVKQDFLHFTEMWAWYLAKWEIVKAITEGENMSTAEQRAIRVIRQYYGNLTREVLANEEYTLKVLKWLRERSLDPDVDYDGIQNVQFITTKFTTDDKARYYRFVNTTVNIADQTFNRSVLHVGWFNGSDLTESLSGGIVGNGGVPFKVNGITVATLSPGSGSKTFAVDLGINCVNVTLALGGNSKNVMLPEPVSGIRGNVQYSCSWNPNTGLVMCDATVTLYGSDYVIKVVTVDSEPLNYTGKVIWEKSEYDQLLNDINSVYEQMKDNIHAFVTSVSAEYVRGEINISDLVDPYMLVSQMVRDAGSTQYYAYVAAELALLGIPTNITKTWTIRLDDNTTLEGILLADYVGKIKVGERYRFPFAYMLTDEGLYCLNNVNFTVVRIRDHTGEDLNETELVNYNMQTGNVSRLKQELEQLNKLWEDYNKIQPVTGGGWDFSDWWAGLDVYAKAGVVVIGAVAVYAIFRR